MNYPPKVIIDSFLEPVTPFECKAQCRIDVTDYSQDSLLDIYIGAARAYLEDRSGRTFHQKTLEWIFDCFPSSRECPLELRGATPLIDLASVKYKDSGGTETTWGSANYLADPDSLVGRVLPAYGIQWPLFTPYPLAAIRVRGTAGIATTSPLTEAPNEVKYPMMLLVAGMYEMRESEVVTDKAFLAVASIKYGVEAFISKLKVEYAF